MTRVSIASLLFEIVCDSLIINSDASFVLIGMSSVVVPADALPPFGDNGQSMALVTARMGIKHKCNVYTSTAILQHGVFISMPRWMRNAPHLKFMAKLVAVSDLRGGVSPVRHVCFERPVVKDGKMQRYPRGGKIFGTRDRICSYLAEYIMMQSRSPFDLNCTSLYWCNYNEANPDVPMAVHPYLDIDISAVDASATANDVFPPVYAALQAMNEKLMTAASVERVRSVIFHNVRETSKGQCKWSFHLHWPDFVLSGNEEMRALAVQMKAICPDVDIGVYANQNQLMRLPFCGKSNSGLSVLRPVIPEKLDATTWTLLPVETTNATTIASFINASCTCTRFPAEFTSVVCTTVERPLLSVDNEPVQSSNGWLLPMSEEIDHGSNYRAWMTFWVPILRQFVIPNFMAFRRRHAGVLGVNCAAPTIDMFDFSDIRRLREAPTMFCIQATGDAFCEYDNGRTPHYHDVSSNSISYVINLNNGSIAQFCNQCNIRPDERNWYNFIPKRSLSFDIVESWRGSDDSDSMVLPKQSNGNQFFVRYFSETIVYVEDIGIVMVYDDTTGCWVRGRRANQICAAKYRQMNLEYRQYRVARNCQLKETAILRLYDASPPLDAAFMELETQRLMDKCAKDNGSIGPLWSLTLLQESDIIKLLGTVDYVNRVAMMEPSPNVVPLREKQCIDIYTWTEREIRPEDYFVSVLNANIINLNDDSIASFRAWQRQVCCGDEEYITYKLRIMGLSLTLFNFDRSFYMPLGPIGRNGKSSECTLFNQVTMSTQPARGCTISREYLTKQGQDRKGANAADTVLMDMANKTILVADECRDTAIDCALIKTLVSGDTTSARNLYESERTNISPRGCLWVITNKTVKLDYTDTALVNRLRVLPYKAQWVSNPSETCSKMTDAFLRGWVFQDDPYFKDRVLPSWNDAMATTCLYELHKFFKTLVPDPDNPDVPLKLSRIPVPSAVRIATSQLVQQEHPVLAFVAEFMHKSGASDLRVCVPVNYAFQNFQRYARNSNSMKMKAMTITQFKEALGREHINVATTSDGMEVFKNYQLSREVPDMARDNTMPMDGYSYCPPPVMGSPTRKRYRDNSE